MARFNVLIYRPNNILTSCSRASLRIYYVFVITVIIIIITSLWISFG